MATYRLMCSKHGLLWEKEWLRLVNKLYCLECLAEFLSKEIGELENVKDTADKSSSK